MEYSEFCNIAAVLKSVYNNVFLTEQSVEIWYQMLSDLDYGVTSKAVKNWISTQKWAPTIADIRAGVVDLVSDPEPDWSEGWEAVIRAVGRWGMHREKEALESMPETARKTVQRMGWKNICLSEEVSVERANFRQIYVNIAEKEKKERTQKGGLLEKDNGRYALPEQG